MHTVKLPAYVTELAMKRRGRVHQFDSIDLARTAHIVVDMQQGFTQPGQPGEVPLSREIIPAINRISEAVRSTGGLVVYIQNTVDEAAAAEWPTWFNHFMHPSRVKAMQDTFSIGRPGHALDERLDVRPEDWKVIKRRYSAFVTGASDLHDRLQARNIDTVIITGTVTNVCCESTARDAMMMNYKVVFPSDANAAFTDEEHNASLATLALLFADVMTTDETIGLIERSRRSS